LEKKVLDLMWVWKEPSTEQCEHFQFTDDGQQEYKCVVVVPWNGFRWKCGKSSWWCNGWGLR
jgi:hypothetical protein